MMLEQRLLIERSTVAMALILGAAATLCQKV
jgi:hypothetical protein